MEDAKSHGQRVPGMEGDRAVKLIYNFVVQQVADGYIAVTIGADIDKFGGMIRLNRNHEVTAERDNGRRDRNGAEETV